MCQDEGCWPVAWLVNHMKKIRVAMFILIFLFIATVIEGMMLKQGNSRVQSGDSIEREGDLFTHEGAEVQNIDSQTSGDSCQALLLWPSWYKQDLNLCKMLIIRLMCINTRDSGPGWDSRQVQFAVSGRGLFWRIGSPAAPVHFRRDPI